MEKMCLKVPPEIVKMCQLNGLSIGLWTGDHI